MMDISKLIHKEEVSEYDFKFSHPSIIVLCAPTLAGKTTFLTKLMNGKDEYFSKKISDIHIFYSVYQNKYKEIETGNKGQTFLHLIGDGVIDYFYIEEINGSILIFDDIIHFFSKKMCESLYVKTHHNENTMIGFVNDHRVN